MSRARGTGVDHPTVVVTHHHQIELRLSERSDKVTEVQPPIGFLYDLLVSKDLLNNGGHGGWNSRVPASLYRRL